MDLGAGGGGQTHEPVAEVAPMASVTATTTIDADAERKFKKLRKEIEIMVDFIQDKSNFH